MIITCRPILHSCQQSRPQFINTYIHFVLFQSCSISETDPLLYPHAPSTPIFLHAVWR